MSAKKTAAAALTPKRVRAWLEKNPEFLVENPDLLDSLKIPHDEDGTISFQTYRLRHLHERNLQLEALFREAGRNQKLIDHALALGAETAEDRPRGLRQAVEAQERRLRRHFPNARWAVRLRPELPKAPAACRIPEHPALIKAVMAVFRSGPRILHDRETVALLWPQADAESEALVIAPLKRQRRYGILCRELPPGSDHDSNTELLMQVANLTAALIARLAPGGARGAVKPKQQD